MLSQASVLGSHLCTTGHQPVMFLHTNQSVRVRARLQQHNGGRTWIDIRNFCRLVNRSSR